MSTGSGQGMETGVIMRWSVEGQERGQHSSFPIDQNTNFGAVPDGWIRLLVYCSELVDVEESVVEVEVYGRRMASAPSRRNADGKHVFQTIFEVPQPRDAHQVTLTVSPAAHPGAGPARPVGRLSFPTASLDGGMEGGFGLLDEYGRPVTARDGKRGAKLFIQGIRNVSTAHTQAGPPQSLPQVSRLGLAASLPVQEPYQGPPVGGTAGVKLFLQVGKESVGNEASFATSIRSGLARDVGVPERRFQYCGMAKEPTVPGYPPCSTICFNIVPYQDHSVRPSANIASEIILRACDPQGLRTHEFPLSLVRSALPSSPMPSASVQLPQPDTTSSLPLAHAERKRVGDPFPSISLPEKDPTSVQEILRRIDPDAPSQPTHTPAKQLSPQAPPPEPEPPAHQPPPPPADDRVFATRPPPPPEERVSAIPASSISTQTDEPPAPPPPPPPQQTAPPSSVPPAAPSSSGLRASQVIAPPKESGGEFFQTLGSKPKAVVGTEDQDQWRVMFCVMESRDVCLDGASGVFSCASLVDPQVISQGQVGLRHAPALGSIIDLAKKVASWESGMVRIQPMHTSDVSHQDGSPAWKDPADLRLALQSPNELGALVREDVLLLVSVHTVDFWGVETEVGQAEVVLRRSQRLDTWLPLQKGKLAASHPKSGKPCLLHIDAIYEPVPKAKALRAVHDTPQLGSWVVESVVGSIHSVFGGFKSETEPQQQAQEKDQSQRQEEVSMYRREMQLALAQDANWEAFGTSNGMESKDGRVELEVVEGAIVALKALHGAGWEIVALTAAESNEAEAAVRTLREFGIVDMNRGPVLEHNLLFVSHWRQVALIVTRLQGLSAAVAPRCSTLTSISLSVTGGLHCVLFNPTADDRALFHEAQTLQAKDELVLQGLLEQLADVYSKMEDIRHRASDAGMTNAELQSPPGANPPQRGTSAAVERIRGNLAAAYQSLVQKEILLLRRAQPLVRLGPSPLSVVPRGAGDAAAHMGAHGDGWKNTWGDMCETLGVDKEKLLLYDDRKAMTSGLVSLGVMQPPDPRPFFPLRDESIKIHSDKLAKLNTSILRTQPKIGVGIVVESGGFTSEGREEWCVASVDPGGHAARSNKIRVGDRIVAINGCVLLASMTSLYVNGLLQGAPGTAVLLSIIRGAQSPQLVLLLRSDSQPLPSGSNGRVVVDLAAVLRRKQPAEVTGLGPDLVINVKRGQNLMEGLDDEALFCRVTVSGPPPYFTPKQMLTGQSVARYGIADWAWVARVPVSEPARQRVTIELLRPNTNDGTSEGNVIVTVAKLVSDGQGWLPLVGQSGEPLPERSGAGAPALLIQAHLHSAPAAAAPPRTPPRVAQRPASAVIELYEHMSEMEKRFGGRKSLKNEIGLDIAAALKVNPERVKVVSLRAGSVLARVNIMPSTLDPRTPSSLVSDLRDMLQDKKSALHVAQTTHHVAGVTEVAYDEAEESDDDDAGTQGGGAERGGADGEALWQLKSEEQGVEDHTKQDARALHTITSRRTLEDLSDSERTVASLNALADGSIKSRDPALAKLPGVVSVMIKPDVSSRQRTAKQKAADRLLLRQAIADALFISGNLVHIGGEQGSKQSGDSHAIDVMIANPPEGTKDHSLLKQHDMLRSGMQHQKSAQFVSQVFDTKEPLRALNNTTLNRVTWAQVIREPVMVESLRVYDLLAGVVREKTPVQAKVEKKAKKEAMAVHAANRIWVSDPVLGRVWEEIQQEDGKIWLDHSRKVMSRSHPSFLLPLPDGWVEKLDLQRHIYYVNGDGEAQWEHPFAQNMEVLTEKIDEVEVDVAVDDMGVLGIEIEEVLKVGDETSSIVVKSVSPGGAGDKSGLIPGDVIARIDGDSVSGQSAKDTSSKIVGVPGETVRMVLLRTPAFIA